MVALPLALAFGVSSGAGPIAGLYGAIFVGLFAALFGGTPSQISGPTGPMTVVMALIFTEYSALDPVRGPALAFTIVMMGGGLQILLGLLRVGRYINYVPQPVISGFMTGIGVIIIALQLRPLLGYPAAGAPLAALQALPEALVSPVWPTLWLGLLTLGIVYFTPARVSRMLPAPLLALLVGTVLLTFVVPDDRVSILGDIPTGEELIGIGIIGAGGIAGAHAEGYRALGDRVRVVAVADIDAEKAHRAAAEWGAERAVERYEDLLALPGVEAVSVCTHNLAHCSPTVAALDAGKHVLVEKPMATTAEEALRMVRASQRSGAILMVELKWRFMPQILAARQAVERGDLGRIYYAEAIGWQHRGIPGRNFIVKEVAGGGAVMDNGVYTLDAMLYLLGHPRPLTVSGSTADRIGSQGGGSWAPKQFTVEDFGSAYVRLEGGVTLFFGHSWAINFDEQWQLRVAGDRGGLEVQPLGPELRLRRGGYGDLEEVAVGELPAGSTEIGYAVERFVEAVEEGLASPVPGETALYTNVIFDGLYESARTGREVRVTVPEV